MRRLSPLCFLITLVAASVAADLRGPHPLGPLVNSPFDDGSPSWSPDGTVVLFDSNRPFGPISTASPEIVFPPLKRLMVTQLAGPAQIMPIGVALPAILTDFGGPTISSEGDLIYFTFSPFTDGLGPHPTLVRGPYAEGVVGPFEPVFDDSTLPFVVIANPHVSTDGNTLIFGARLPTSAGMPSDWNLFLSRRVFGEWTPPVPLPRPINSPYDETSGNLSADGRILLFDSNRPLPVHAPPPSPEDMFDPMVGGIWPSVTDMTSGEDRHRGSFDVFSALRTPDGGFRFVQRLGRGVNSRAAEVEPALSPDGSLLLFASNRPRREPPPPEPIDIAPELALYTPEELGSPDIEPPPGEPRDFDLFVSRVANELDVDAPTHVQPGAHAVITATWDAAPWGGPYRANLAITAPARVRTEVSDPNPVVFEVDPDHVRVGGPRGTAVWVIRIPHEAPRVIHVVVRIHNAYQSLVERRAIIVLPGHSPEVPSDEVVDHLTGSATLDPSNQGAADANADGAINSGDVVTLTNRGL
jgi:hypothetical protein